MSRLFALVVVALVWVQQGAAINPDALKTLVKWYRTNWVWGSILGERCAMHEEALRYGPSGKDFANLNRYELMESVLKFKSDSNPLDNTEGRLILDDIRKCLLPNPTFDDKKTKRTSAHIPAENFEIEAYTLKRLLAPYLRSWYNTAQERCAAYEEALRDERGDLKFVDSYQLMEAILDNKEKSYPLTGLDAVPIREDIRRCIYPDKFPEPKPYNASNDQAPEDRPRRIAAIRPDALMRLLDIKLSENTPGERCIAYEESLRNEPDGGEFANLSRYELLRSILSDRSANNPLNDPNNYRIINDVKECLFTRDTYEFDLIKLVKFFPNLIHRELEQPCRIVDHEIRKAMGEDHPLYQAPKSERFQQAILDLKELRNENCNLFRLLEECVNRLPEYQA